MITKKSAENKLYYIYGNEACCSKALIIPLGVPKRQSQSSPKHVFLTQSKGFTDIDFLSFWHLHEVRVSFINVLGFPQDHSAGVSDKFTALDGFAITRKNLWQVFLLPSMTRNHASLIKSFSLITKALLSNYLKKISNEKPFRSCAVCFA